MFKSICKRKISVTLLNKQEEWFDEPEDDVDKKEEESVFEEIKDRSNVRQISPQLNPQNFNESDYWRSHWISMEG